METPTSAPMITVECLVTRVIHQKLMVTVRVLDTITTNELEEAAQREAKSYFDSDWTTRSDKIGLSTHRIIEAPKA